METFARITYFVMGIVQFFATWDGVTYGMGVGSVFGFIISLLVAGIPLVGSITGMYGAMTVWEWGFLQAFILFFWYIPLLAVVYGYGWFAERRQS